MWTKLSHSTLHSSFRMTPTSHEHSASVCVQGDCGSPEFSAEEPVDAVSGECTTLSSRAGRESQLCVSQTFE
jgi:hypothetical protein